MHRATQSVRQTPTLQVHDILESLCLKAEVHLWLMTSIVPSLYRFLKRRDSKILSETRSSGCLLPSAIRLFAGPFVKQLAFYLRRRVLFAALVTNDVLFRPGSVRRFASHPVACEGLEMKGYKSLPGWPRRKGGWGWGWGFSSQFEGLNLCCLTSGRHFLHKRRNPGICARVVFPNR